MPTDGLALFGGPKAQAQEMVGVLTAGAIIERRDEESWPVNPGAPPRPISGKGPLWRVFVNGHEARFTFSGGLEPAPDGLPTREAICIAAAAASGPAVKRAGCLAGARFLLLEGGAPTRRLAVATPTGVETSRLTILDLAQLRAGRPAETSHLDLGAQSSWRQVLLPGDWLLLVVEEFVREGTISGTRFALISLSPEGALARQADAPAVSTELKGPLAVQRRFTAEVERTPAGPVLSVKGSETVQVIATAAVRSTKERVRVYRWDSVHHKLLTGDR